MGAADSSLRSGGLQAAVFPDDKPTLPAAWTPPLGA